MLNRLPKTYFVQNEFHHLKYNCDTLTCLKKYPQEHIIQLGTFCSLSSCISWMHAGNGLVQLQTCRIISILPLRGPLIIHSSPILGSREAFLSFPFIRWCQKICHCFFSSASRCSDCHSLWFRDTFFPLFYTVNSIWGKNQRFVYVAPIVYHVLCYWYLIM